MQTKLMSFIIAISNSREISNRCIYQCIFSCKLHIDKICGREKITKTCILHKHLEWVRRFRYILNVNLDSLSTMNEHEWKWLQKRDENKLVDEWKYEEQTLDPYYFSFITKICLERSCFKTPKNKQRKQYSVEKIVLPYCLVIPKI